MWIVWTTVTAATLVALAVWTSLLPAFRRAPLSWRVVSASGVPLSILGVNFVIRFWNPTAGPYRANQRYPFGDHLHAWAVSFGFTCSLGHTSRPGTQPANLQGIWNKDMNPMWDSKYTTNINTEMNYWPAEVANLGETAQPLFTCLLYTSDAADE